MVVELAQQRLAFTTQIEGILWIKLTFKNLALNKLVFEWEATFTFSRSTSPITRTSIPKTALLNRLTCVTISRFFENHFRNRQKMFISLLLQQLL